MEEECLLEGPLAAYVSVTDLENGYYLLSRARRANIKKRHLLDVLEAG